ncbi:MAG TPA: 3-hydroxyacyl-CoA dehydrogenase NAD-binding domain-containing protein, partial [Thermoanaerobaculia bacterium]
MRVDKIGVIGAGVMGAGVAQDLAQHGRQVVLVDLDDEKLAKARHEIRASLRLQGLLGRPAPAEGSAAVLARVACTTAYDSLAEVDFVIENVVEKWPVKEQVYRRLDAVCPPACVFAANTSAISITRIGAVTRRADRVVGMHFMNPVPLKPMVEVIRGFHTSEATLARVLELLALLGKEDS